MLEKYIDSLVPPVTEINQGLIDTLANTVWPAYTGAMERWRFDLALEATWKFVTYCDQLISDSEPWKLAKAGDMVKVHNLLYHLAEGLRHIAIMIWPVLPETSEKIITQLGLEIATELKKPLSELQQWVELVVGNKINKQAILFPRIEKTSP